MAIRVLIIQHPTYIQAIRVIHLGILGIVMRAPIQTHHHRHFQATDLQALIPVHLELLSKLPSHHPRLVDQMATPLKVQIYTFRLVDV